MGLPDLLFRCPFCGHDPMEGEKLEARCPRCGRSFRPGGPGTMIAVSHPEGSTEEVPAGELSRRMEALGGAIDRARGDAGHLRFESRVRVRWADVEEPIRFRDVLLGYAELFGAGREGSLLLDHDRLVLTLEGGEGESVAWPLLELGALQTSSSSVQISPKGGGVVLFRFPDESTRRWEELLRTAISLAWREAGRGEVIEFQPRIRTR
jgi:hypothetical protein